MRFGPQIIRGSHLWQQFRMEPFCVTKFRCICFNRQVDQGDNLLGKIVDIHVGKANYSNERTALGSLLEDINSL